jgi:hypothetical protein
MISPTRMNLGVASKEGPKNAGVRACEKHVGVAPYSRQSGKLQHLEQLGRLAFDGTGKRLLRSSRVSQSKRFGCHRTAVTSTHTGSSGEHLVP